MSDKAQVVALIDVKRFGMKIWFLGQIVGRVIAFLKLPVFLETKPMRSADTVEI